ncbi:AAA family ATPase [uncultured virus]|nr:AAA family ATPase [uncultured virus]
MVKDFEMGAGSSSMTNMLGGLEENAGFGDYGISRQNFTPINKEGIPLKLNDSTTATVYDLSVTKLTNVQLEEYLLEVDKEVYRKFRDFVIISDELRRCLRNLEILDSDMRYENKPRLNEIFCIKNFPILEFKAKKHHIISELVSFIKALCPIFEKMDETIADGVIPVTALGYYLKIGTKVVLHGKEIKQGAYIQNVNGATVSCTTLSQNRHGKFVEYKIDVPLSEQSYTQEELHKQIQPISEDDQVYKDLTERGAAIVACKGKVQYLNYTGPTFSEPNVISSYQKDIRVMLDLKNNIPDSYNERLAKIGSNNKELDTVSKNQLFSVLGVVPVYYIERGGYISVAFDALKPIQFNEKYYQELVLDDKYKKFLSLVTSNHYKSKQVDVIKGKGNGLLFVLSGPPGVGKTMTAEALAEKNHVPLMIISFGGLGTTPDNVEQALKLIMQLAEYWNAVLLFDEADVFLESRNNSSDVARNAIVGVFLQALEYHKGVIFLTTNRETSLDAAIISRAILKIKYHPLNQDQTLAVWTNMLSRVTENPRNLMYGMTSDPATITSITSITNGRDIRNVIRMALIYAGDSKLTTQHINKALLLHGSD